MALPVPLAGHPPVPRSTSAARQRPPAARDSALRAIMCGRFTLRSPAQLLQEIFGLPALPGIRPRYNIAPSQPVAAVRGGLGSRSLEEMRWGLVPYWAEDPAIGNRMINARAETVASKPVFREPFRHRRCLLPADGFYEWQPADGGRKQPWLLTRADGSPFAFAGVWDRWRSPAGGPELRSCALLTTGPNEIVAPIHDRMPVMLAGEELDTWLDDDARPDDLLRLCRPFRGQMTATPVSVRVNDPAHDDPGCLEPVSRPPGAPRLFD